MKRILLVLLAGVLAAQAQTVNSAGASASQLAAEAAARAAADNTEASARIAGDATNAAAITAETTRATAAEDELETGLAAETNARIIADNNEVSARAAADATNSAAITAESTARANGDAANLAAINAHATSTSNPHGVTAAQVGLGNVNNTSDADKPISTATQAALNLKASLAANTYSGNQSAPAFVGDSFQATASRVVGVTSSRDLTAADNGKLVNVTGTAAVTLTVPAGLASGWSTEVANITTGDAAPAGSVSIVASGVTLNGGTSGISIARGCVATVRWVATNAYAMTVSPMASPRTDLATNMPAALMWQTPTSTANTSSQHYYGAWRAMLTGTSTVPGNYVLFQAAYVPLARNGSGGNLRLAGSRFSVLLDLYSNGFSGNECRLLIGVGPGATSLAASGLAVVWTSATTAKLQLHNGTTLTESTVFATAPFDISRLNRWLVTWDGETNTLALFQQNQLEQGRPPRFAPIGSLTATPSTTGSGQNVGFTNFCTSVPAFGPFLDLRASYWFNDTIVP